MKKITFTKMAIISVLSVFCIEVSAQDIDSTCPTSLTISVNGVVPASENGSPPPTDKNMKALQDRLSGQGVTVTFKKQLSNYCYYNNGTDVTKSVAAVMDESGKLGIWAQLSPYVFYSDERWTPIEVKYSFTIETSQLIDFAKVGETDSYEGCTTADFICGMAGQKWWNIEHFSVTAHLKNGRTYTVSK